MFRTIGSTFTHRFAATATALALVCSLAAVGCSSASDTNPDAGSTTCDLAGVQALFVAKGCTTIGCHDSASGSAGLDLKSAGLADRLLNKGPTTGGNPSVASSCTGMGKIYLTPHSNPAMGLFIDKLTASPGCGARMPLGGAALNASEMDCVRSWALTVTSP